MRLCVRLDPGNADWETGDRGEQGWEDSRRFVVPLSFFLTEACRKEARVVPAELLRNVGSLGRVLLPVLGVS